MSKLAKSVSEAVKNLKSKKVEGSAKAASKAKIVPASKTRKPVESKPDPQAIVEKAPELKDLRVYVSNGTYQCKACSQTFEGVENFNAHAKEKHGAVETTHAAAKPEEKKGESKATKSAEEKAAKETSEKSGSAKEQAITSASGYLGLVVNQLNDGQPHTLESIYTGIGRKGSLTSEQLHKRIHASLNVLRHKGKLIDTREKGKPNLYALKPSAIEEMKNIGTQSAWYSGIFGTKQLTGGPYAKSSAALLAVSNGRTEAGSKAGAGCYKRTEGKGKDAVVYVVMSAAYAAANGYILPAKN